MKTSYLGTVRLSLILAETRARALWTNQPVKAKIKTWQRWKSSLRDW